MTKCYPMVNILFNILLSTAVTRWQIQLVSIKPQRPQGDTHVIPQGLFRVQPAVLNSTYIRYTVCKAEKAWPSMIDLSCIFFNYMYCTVAFDSRWSPFHLIQTFSCHLLLYMVDFSSVCTTEPPCVSNLD